MMRGSIALCLLLLQPAMPNAQPQQPIIDMHMHARTKVMRGPDGKVMGRGCTPQPCVEPAPVFLTDDGPLKGTLAAMDRYQIVLGFLSDTLENVDRWMTAAPN